MANNETVVYLSLSTFAGIVPVATHYYAKLKTSSEKEVELKHRITAKEAKELNYVDSGLSYWAGELSSRFPNEETARKAGIKDWRKHFPKGIVLIEGDPVYLDPSPILRGRVKSLRVIVNKWRELGGFDRYSYIWERHKKKANDLCKSWDKLLEVIEKQ